MAGFIVYLAAHRGREVGAHMIDTDAPGYVPPAGDAAPPEDAAALKEAP